MLHWNRARVSVAGILEKLNLLVYQTNTEDLLTSSDGVQQMDAKMLALSRYRNNDSVVVCEEGYTLKITQITQSKITHGGPYGWQCDHDYPRRAHAG